MNSRLKLKAYRFLKKYVLVRSKDSLTAFNAARKNEIQGKGRIANLTTTHIFQYLQLLGIFSIEIKTLCQFQA